jgi:hypothetical protein
MLPSKAQLETRLERAQERFSDAATTTNSLIVTNASALAAGFMTQKMAGDGQFEVMGAPVVPTLGGILAGAAVMGFGGKKARRTMLDVSKGLTAAFLFEQGRALAKK